jgi:hypothetical protein
MMVKDEMIKVVYSESEKWKEDVFAFLDADREISFLQMPYAQTVTLKLTEMHVK